MQGSEPWNVFLLKHKLFGQILTLRSMRCESYRLKADSTSPVKRRQGEACIAPQLTSKHLSALFKICIGPSPKNYGVSSRFPTLKYVEAYA